MGFDYKALELVADVLGVEITPGILRKIRAVEAEIVKKAGKNGEP